MPICEIDPWRTQYFENAACPADVFIPTEDSDGWLWNPAHRWIYDKLAVAMSQGLDAAPHGVAPQNYPVFSKPIYNLKGMGVGSRPLASADDYATAYQPGHMWSTLLEGKHVSSDVALVDGAPHWWRHAGGIASGDGTFDCWEVRADAGPPSKNGAARGAGASRGLHRHGQSRDHRRAHHRGATCASPTSGPISTARAGSRPSVGLYAKGEWRFDDSARRTGYSVVLFAPHGAAYRHPPAERCSGKSPALPGVSSLQITFHEDLPPARHAMPPGGFRVAIVNCWDRAAGNAARDCCAAHFDATTAASRLEISPRKPANRLTMNSTSAMTNRYLRHAGRRRGDPAEAEHRGHQRDHEEHQRPIQHSRSPSSLRATCASSGVPVGGQQPLAALQAFPPSP